MATLQAYREIIDIPTVYRVKEGYKMVPFQRESAPDMNYNLYQRCIVSTNLPSGRIGSTAHSTIWGETHLNTIDTALYTYKNPTITSDGIEAYHKAYAKFRDAVYQQGELLAAIAERKDAFELIFKRSSQLVKAAKALRRGRFGDFLQICQILPKKKDRGRRTSRPKQFSSLWLEYWMGWSPMAGDIYHAASVLGSQPSEVEVKVAASTTIYRKSVSSSRGAVATSVVNGKARVYLKGLVTVTNPTLFKLNQLGLTNPLATAWQLIPFSFIADWFLNIGNVLAQVTDWLGLKLKNLCLSTKTVGSSDWICTNAPARFGASFPLTAEKHMTYAYFTRKANLWNLPAIKPKVKIPGGLSLTRGLTSISLLIQLLK